MSTASLSTDTATTSSKGTATAIAVGCVLSGIGAAAYMGSIAFDPGLTPREWSSSIFKTVQGTLTTLGVVILALALARWRTTLPTWAVMSAAAGLVVVAANAWFYAVGIRAISDHTTDQEYERLIFEAPWLIVMFVPKMVLGLVAFITLAVVGWRQRSLPRSSSVLLVLAGLLSLWPPYPPALLLASIALFIASRAMTPSLTTRPTT